MSREAALIYSHCKEWFYQSLVDRAIIGLLTASAIVPFYFLPGFTGWARTAVHFAPAGLCLILAICRKRSIASDWAALDPSIRYAVGVAILASGMATAVAPEPQTALAKLLYYTVTGELLFVLCAGLSRDACRDAVKWIVASASVVAAYGILESVEFLGIYRDYIFSGNEQVARLGGLSGRPTSTVGSPVPLGTYLGLCLPFFLCGALCRTSLLRGLGYWVLFGLLIALLFKTESRGALAAGWIGGAVFLWCVRPRLVKWWLVVLGLLLVGAWYEGMVAKTVKQVILDYGAYHRTQSIGYSLRTWWEYPVFGTGLGGFAHHAMPMGSRLQVPDNMYLLILAESGLVGLVSFLVISSTIISQIGRQCRCDNRSLLLCACLGSISCMVVNMMTWDLLRFPLTRMYFWGVAGIGISMLRSRKD